MNKILLVTLVHNRKPLLGACIKSSLAQTLSPNKFDHLLWNNCSTDGAEKIISIVAKKYKNIYMHNSKTNMDQQQVYNIILRDIIPNRFKDKNYEIMVILDSDDELYPDCLLEVHKMFSKHPEIGGAYTDFSIIDDYSNIKIEKHGKPKLIPNQFTKEGQLALRRRQIASSICSHARCYRISALKDIGGFDESKKYCTDFSIFCFLMEKYPVVKIETGKPLYKFRIHNFGQIQGKNSPLQTKQYYELQAYFKERWTAKGLI